MKKIIILMLLILAIIPFVFAIKGEIGNARAVINTDWKGKETIERTILVRNSNDVPIDITLTPTEEIEEIIDLIDEEFRLDPGEEKKARFDIVLKKPGKWVGKIMVKFSPDEGNSVVLASNLIINAKAEDDAEIPEEIPDEEDEEVDVIDDDELEEDDNEMTGDVGFEFGGRSEDRGSDSSGVVVLIIILAVVIIGAVGGGVYFLRK